MSEEYVLRIVIPFRDYKRIKDIFKIVDRKNIRTKNVVRDPIFPERADMDVLEYIYILKLTKDERRELYSLLSQNLSGTIGFFLLYKYDKKGYFSKI